MLHPPCVFTSKVSVLFTHCVSCGDYVLFFSRAVMSSLQHVGDLGNIVAGPDGRASFRLEDSQLKVTHTQRHTNTHTQP